MPRQPKRHKDDMTARLEREAWDLRRKGWSQERIAEKLKVDQSTVSRMLRRTEDRLNKEFKERAERLKIEQLARLDYIIDESLEEWRRSKRNARASRETTKELVTRPAKPKPGEDGADGEDGRPEVSGMYLGEDGEEVSDEEREAKRESAIKPGEELTVVERKRIHDDKGRIGEAALLAQARGAMADQRVILGIDAPSKQEISGPGGKPLNAASATVTFTLPENGRDTAAETPTAPTPEPTSEPAPEGDNGESKG